MSVDDALAIFASAVFLVRLLPQPARLARHGVAAGVSPVAALNSVISAVAWIAYGGIQGLPVVWGVSVLALVPCTWQAVLLRRSITARSLRSSALFAGTLVVAGLLGVLGVALAGTVAVTIGPQVRIALTQRDLSGISPATYWVALVDAAAWGAYGMAVDDAALVGYFVVLVVGASVILARIGHTRRSVQPSTA